MKKDQNYSVRFSEAMLQFLVNYSKKYDMLPSEYLREIIRKEMIKEMSEERAKTNKQNTK